MITPYHAKYFAHDLVRKKPSSADDRLSRALFDAAVDLNPHQIDAATFALRSPLSSGVILADEVGLGKTIEAGLVLCQFWAERRRRLLVICPASLRKQWSLELEEKFALPTLVLDARSIRATLGAHDGDGQLPGGAVLIMSINFASAVRDQIRATQWDLVAIDEAHKLRNAYRPSNRMGQNLRWALEGKRKLLLTATPLQNSLLELYGLSTVIDERIFGDRSAFREQYMRQDGDLRELKARLAPFCKRTLRKQVLEYISYTERRALTVPFTPTAEEQRLYEDISLFLAREDTFSVPARQRTLVTLILRKLLGSSSEAIAGTLETMRGRLLRLREAVSVTEGEDDLLAELTDEDDLEADYVDEELGDEAAEVEAQQVSVARPSDAEAAEDVVEGSAIDADGADDETARLKRMREALDVEIAQLDAFIERARAIAVDTKSRALLVALEKGFAEMTKLGAARKAVIFTESRRTQQYLRDFLEARGYEGRLVLFSGANSGPEATAVYERWFEANRESGRASGSRQVDIRTALIEHFRDSADVMIATEAAAEGVNLQFCSLVINYDLPWNPQRIEQRIGRCHRYGQRHDVVVINFLNESNEADRRLLELLNEKLRLFNGVFGSSDEVLGAIESGVDFERRILDIYQACREPREIEAAFGRLRAEMDEAIQARMADTRRVLLEEFDEDVHARLRSRLDTTRRFLDTVERSFWLLTRYVLGDAAIFDDKELCFSLLEAPLPSVRSGRYHLISKTVHNDAGEYLYRLSHPLAEWVIEQGQAAHTPMASVTFDVSGLTTRVTQARELKGKAGWLVLEGLAIDSLELEEYLLFTAVTDSGEVLDQERCERLFRCDGTVDAAPDLPTATAERLASEGRRRAEATVAASFEANNRFFQQERDRLERWADDKVKAAEKELADVKADIRAAKREERLAASVDEQHRLQVRIKELEQKKRRLRQRIFDVEDEIADKRDELIAALEKRLAQRTSRTPLFTVRWSVT
jgi:hypothetical protein